MKKGLFIAGLIFAALITKGLALLVYGIYRLVKYRREKMVSGIVSIVLGGALLAAPVSNNQATSNANIPKETAKPAATTTQTAPVNPQPAPQPAPAPKPAPSPAPSTQDPEIQNYVNQLSKNAERMSTDWTELTALFSNPTLDDDWKLKCATALVDMQLNIEEAHKMKPPKIFEHVHETYLKGMDEYNVLVQRLPKAIDNQDTNEIASLVDYINRGTQYINQATQELKDMIKSHKIQASY